MKYLALVLGITSLAVLLNTISPLKDVQTGKKQLRCDVGNGMQVIDGSKVVDFVDDRWFFVNGSAANCEVR